MQHSTRSPYSVTLEINETLPKIQLLEPDVQRSEFYLLSIPAKPD
jgi:hypothetical protein